MEKHYNKNILILYNDIKIYLLRLHKTPVAFKCQILQYNSVSLLVVQMYSA